MSRAQAKPLGSTLDVHDGLAAQPGRFGEPVDAPSPLAPKPRDLVPEGTHVTGRGRFAHASTLGQCTKVRSPLKFPKCSRWARAPQGLTSSSQLGRQSDGVQTPSRTRGGVAGVAVDRVQHTRTFAKYGQMIEAQINQDCYTLGETATLPPVTHRPRRCDAGHATPSPSPYSALSQPAQRSDSASSCSSC